MLYVYIAIPPYFCLHVNYKLSAEKSQEISFWGQVSQRKKFRFGDTSRKKIQSLNAGDTQFRPRTWRKGTDRSVQKVQECGRKGMSQASKYYENITEIW